MKGKSRPYGSVKSMAIEKARQMYRERLERGGTSEMAINLALSAGTEFLMYYDRARRQINALKNTGKKQEKYAQ